MLFFRDSKDRLSNSLFNKMRIVAIDSNYSVSLKHTFSTNAREICFLCMTRLRIRLYIQMYIVQHNALKMVLSMD